jgi:hypothetical protein
LTTILREFLPQAASYRLHAACSLKRVAKIIKLRSIIVNVLPA